MMISPYQPTLSADYATPFPSRHFDLVHYLHSVALHALRADWDIVCWHEQPGILGLIAQVKNERMLGVA